MIIEVIVLPGLATNCYLVGCEKTRETAVIDPGEEPQTILKRIKAAGLKAKYIINTHGHADHIMANGEIKKATGAQILIHEEDAPYLTDPHKSLVEIMGYNVRVPEADKLLKEGDVIHIGTTVKLEVLHTPGHTPGGISLVTDKVIFSGDTLFAGSIGRTDLPGGSYEQLIESVKGKLLKLGDDFIVYPGHGPTTTLGEERVSNPFLN